MTERKQISLQKDNTQAALDSLQSSLKDALHSLLVSHCAGYVSSTEYGIKRSSIEGHISNCEIIRAAITAQQTDVAGALDYNYIDKLIDDHLVVNPDTMTYDLDRGNIQWFIAKVLECEIVTDENFTKVASRKMMDLAELFGNFSTTAGNADQEAWDHLLVYHPCANNPNKILPIKVDGGKTPYEKGFDDCFRKFCIKNTKDFKNQVTNAVQKIRHNELSADAGSAICEAIDYLADINCVFNSERSQTSNTELLERAKALVKYCEWQINEGTDHHPTLPSAIVSAKEAISRAEQKGGV